MRVMQRRVTRRGVIAAAFIAGGVGMAAAARGATPDGLAPRARLPEVSADGDAPLAPTPTPAPTAPADPNWHVTGQEVPALAPFDAAMKAFMRKNDVPGGALAVVAGGKLVLARGYAWGAASPQVAPDALFRIASVTKPFTSAAVFTLVQDGKLDLSAPLVSLVSMTPPSGQAMDPRLGSITVLDVLQHLGGWDRDLTFDPMFDDQNIAGALGLKLPISRTDIIRFMAGQPLQHDPGSTYSYSNFGYLLLGRLIENVSGMPYPRYVQERVLAPLGITGMRQGRSLLKDRAEDEVAYTSTLHGPTVVTASGETVPLPYGGFNLENMQSHGAWLASAVDLVRFATMFDAGTSDTVLTSASRDATFARPGNAKPSDVVYYGCGWEVRDLGGGQRNIWHNGSLSGTNTLLVHNASDRSWAALFNRRNETGKPNADGEIDPDLQSAAAAVKDWPSLDQFPSFAGSA
jgi:CubicO group peptidase (beta-lactamase class C family)